MTNRPPQKKRKTEICHTNRTEPKGKQTQKTVPLAAGNVCSTKIHKVTKVFSINTPEHLFSSRKSNVFVHSCCRNKPNFYKKISKIKRRKPAKDKKRGCLGARQGTRQQTRSTFLEKRSDVCFCLSIKTPFKNRFLLA